MALLLCCAVRPSFFFSLFSRLLLAFSGAVLGHGVLQVEASRGRRTRFSVWNREDIRAVRPSVRPGQLVGGNPQGLAGQVGSFAAAAAAAAASGGGSAAEEAERPPVVAKPRRRASVEAVPVPEAAAVAAVGAEGPLPPGWVEVRGVLHWSSARTAASCRGGEGVL